MVPAFAGVGGFAGEVDRSADAEVNFGAAGDFFVRWHGFEGAFEMAGDDGAAAIGDEHAYAGAEGGHVAGTGAGAFGEEDVAAGFGEEAFAELLHGVAAGVFSPHGQGVHEAGGEGGDDGGFEEGVTGGDGEVVDSSRSGSRGGENEGVEVGRVIGDQHEGGGGGEVFAAFDGDAPASALEGEQAQEKGPPAMARENADCDFRSRV